jgi:hypothetical protein
VQGEVRVLLKEVGDLRESRRALYMYVFPLMMLGPADKSARELADLLLMKGRQSAG